MKSGNYNTSTTKEHAVTRDEGLRSYMLQVYNYMTAALAITGIVAMLAASSDVVMSLLYIRNAAGQYAGMSPIGWAIAFAPLIFAFVFSFGIYKMQANTAKLLLGVFAAIMGLSLSSLFLIYTGGSIAKVFFITASVFGAMSLYGHTTKRDLTGFGNFLVMGLIGIIIASVVNIFLRSPGLDFALSLIGVGIFVGLTAYDTQRLKSIYYAVAGDQESVSKVAVMGALNLYMDFINLFIYLLKFFGDRRQ